MKRAADILLATFRAFRGVVRVPATSLSSCQERIATLFRQNGELTIDQLTDRFGVAPQTIRRDINILCDANGLRHTHGGTKLIAAGSNQPYLRMQSVSPRGLEKPRLRPQT